MYSSRRLGAAVGAAGLVVLSSCIGSDVVSPDVDRSFEPSSAIFDQTTTGPHDFYFLPPLVKGNPNPVGTFNPFLHPEMRVCVISESELGPNGTMTCAGKDPEDMIVEPGSLPFTVDEVNEQYQISWDTDGPETAPINTSEFLLLEILVGNRSMGAIQLDPQDPNGPGQSTADAYPFRLGETIPAKFWPGQELLCDPDADFVTECWTFSVGQDGGSFAIEDLGDRLAVFFEANSLPFFNDDGSLDEDAFIALTLERVEVPEGEKCIPGIDAEGFWDAPLFGDSCLRVTTYPELSEEFLNEVLVSICLNISSLDGIDFLEDQQYQVTMVRYDDNDTPDDPSDDTWEALRDTSGDCSTQVGSLLDVPDQGFMRYAALGINAIADFLGPEPVVASDLRLGGFTGSFSTIAYTLPGQMIATEGTGAIFLEGATQTDVPVTIHVVDHEELPVEDAVVHFATTDGTLNGTGTTFDGVSDSNGDVNVTWTVDASSFGEKTVTASALGLLTGPVPDHVENYLFTAQSIDITATVCQANSGQGTATIDGTFGTAEWACAQHVPFSANISGGTTPAEVWWMNDADNLFLAVRVQQPSLDKVNDVRFDFDNDADGVAELNDDAIGIKGGVFYDQHLDSKCLNRNQSGCGTLDVPHGAAAFGNAGGWTTFELVHPLTGQEGAFDLDVPLAARGDAVFDIGWSTTLQQGNGAQGNTQFPGFRQYMKILIH